MNQVGTISRYNFSDSSQFSDSIADAICKSMGYKRSVDWVGQELFRHRKNDRLGFHRKRYSRWYFSIPLTFFIVRVDIIFPIEQPLFVCNCNGQLSMMIYKIYKITHHWLPIIIQVHNSRRKGTKKWNKYYESWWGGNTIAKIHLFYGKHLLRWGWSRF